MAAKNDGGPASPTNGPDHGVYGAGMTLRDYFMAHAPAEPQPWFRPVMPTMRTKAPTAIPNMTEVEKADLHDWDEGYLGVMDLASPRVRMYAAEFELNRTEGAKWDAEHEKQRYLQWPAAWADAMLAAREAQS